MKNLMTVFRIIRTGEFAIAYRTYCRNYCTDELYTLRKKKIIHPYQTIHPWKSEIEFTNNLLKNIIYNSDGIIAINKPYGIPIINKHQDNKKLFPKECHNIVGAVNYSIKDVLPHVVKELNVPNLIPCIGAEKYMSGVYVFGINDDICNEIYEAKRRANHLNKSIKYWVITTRVPHELKGSYHLAMTLKSKLGNKKPIILTDWSNNMVKRGDVKILNINFKILSNSTHNSSSLIEIEISTRKWHALRLFTSTMLYSPILGDNYHGSRVQEFMGTWMKVDPFAESCWNMPKLNKQLLELLNLTQSQQQIIPAHIHLRNMHLISFGKDKKDIVLSAPLIDPFSWTCKQLMFKNILYDTNDKSIKDEIKACI